MYTPDYSTGSLFEANMLPHSYTFLTKYAVCKQHLSGYPTDYVLTVADPS